MDTLEYSAAKAKRKRCYLHFRKTGEMSRCRVSFFAPGKLWYGAAGFDLGSQIIIGQNSASTVHWTAHRRGNRKAAGAFFLLIVVCFSCLYVCPMACMSINFRVWSGQPMAAAKTGCGLRQVLQGRPGPPPKQLLCLQRAFNTTANGAISFFASWE